MEVEEKEENIYKMINYGSSKLIYLIAIFPHYLRNNI